MPVKTWWTPPHTPQGDQGPHPWCRRGAPPRCRWERGGHGRLRSQWPTNHVARQSCPQCPPCRNALTLTGTRTVASGLRFSGLLTVSGCIWPTLLWAQAPTSARCEASAVLLRSTRHVRLGLARQRCLKDPSRPPSHLLQGREVTGADGNAVMLGRAGRGGSLRPTCSPGNPSVRERAGAQFPILASASYFPAVFLPVQRPSLQLRTTSCGKHRAGLLSLRAGGSQLLPKGSKWPEAST